MHTTTFICPTCANPRVAHATERFFNILSPGGIKGKGITNEEIFALMNISSRYPEFVIQLTKTGSEKDAFLKATEGSGFTYQQFLEHRTRIPSVKDLYRILSIKSLCCQRSIQAAPVWPIYSSVKPPGSIIESDKGEVVRYAMRKNGKIIVGEIGGQVINQEGLPIIAIVEFTVDDDELRALSV